MRYFLSLLLLLNLCGCTYKFGGGPDRELTPQEQAMLQQEKTDRFYLTALALIPAIIVASKE